MTTISRTRSIPSPPQTVWQVLDDFAGIAAWAPNVDHSAAASVPISGLGAVRRVQAGRVALLERIVDYRPSQSLGYALEGLPPPAGTVTTTWRLAAGPAGTEVTITTVIAPLGGPPGRIVSAVLARKLAAAAEQMLDGLATRVSVSPVPAPSVSA